MDTTKESITTAILVNLAKKTPYTILFDSKFNIVYCHESIFESTGYNDSDSFFSSLSNILKFEQKDIDFSIDKFTEMFTIAFSQGHHQFSWRYTTKSGLIFDALASLTRIDGGEDPFGGKYLLVQFHDIQPYVEQIEKEHSFATTYKSIIDVTPFCVNLWNKDLKVILGNNRALELFNLSYEDQFIDEFDRFSPEFQPNGKLSKSFAVEHLKKGFEVGFHKFPWVHLTSDKVEIPSEITLNKINLGGEEVLVSFIKDLRVNVLGGEDDVLYETYFVNRISDRTVFNTISKLSEDWYFSYDVRSSLIRYYGTGIGKFGNVDGISIPIFTVLDHNVIHPDDIESYKLLADNMKNGIYEPLDIRYLQENGLYHYYRLVYQVINNEDENPIFVIGKGLDIHEQKMLEERSKIDLLTQCYNKVSAEELITQIINNATVGQHAFFVIDIDNFKAINDNLGHYFGDDVLRDVADQLKTSFRKNDIIARLGGDEFIVFMEHVGSMDILKEKANKILNVFNKTYSDSKNKYSITGSIGVALFPNNATTFEDLYVCADKALYQAKLLGKNRYMIYDSELINDDKFKLSNVNRALNSYFNFELISHVFEILYDHSHEGCSIQKAIDYIGDKYLADRCYIIESLDNAISYNMNYEWTREGISAEKKSLQNMSSEIFKELIEDSINGVIYSNDIDEYVQRSDAIKLMEKQGVKSFLHVQISKEQDVTFILGLDDCKGKREWNLREINTLQYVAKMISIMRQQERMYGEIKTLTEYNELSVLISDNSDGFVYVADPNTHELEYLNKVAIEAFGLKKESDWKGKKCYEILQGKDSPCEFCTNHLLNEHSFYEWTYYNELLNKTFLIKDRLIRNKNKLSRLEIAMDITNLKNLELQLQEKLNDERLLISCIEKLHTGLDPKTAINKILGEIASFYEAERSYIFEVDGDVINNTFEWCKDGIDAQIDVLQNIPASMVQVWFETFESVGEFYIDSLNGEVDTNDPLFEILKMQNIVSLITAPIKTIDGEILGFIGVDNPKAHIKKTYLLCSVSKFIANFQDQTKMLEELKIFSYYDNLTGIKNRLSFLDAIKRMDSLSDFTLGVAYIDIIKLSSINEAKGVEFGDASIKKLSQVLSVKFDDDVYRVGGDEFIVLKKDISERAFDLAIEELRIALKKEFDFDVSIGYTWNSNVELGEKQNNMNIVNNRYNQVLLRNLQKELESGKFVVYLQPQIALKSGEFVSAEALIRRKDAVGNIQTPFSFIPFYEREGLIAHIDLYVFETVCSTLKSWHESGYKKDVKISVNCSRLTITQQGIKDKFINICKQYQIDHSCIVLELTESMSSDNDEAMIKVIEELSMEGFGISLDDFGNGYSNLTSLMQSNFDEIKLDMELIRELSTDSKSVTLTKAALSLCDEIDNLISVAEGVETEEQFKILKEMNCQKGQGYLFDKPLPIDVFNQKYIKN